MKRTVTKVLLLVFGCGVVWAQDTGNTFADAKSAYSAKCTVCHGIDGAGNTTVGKNLKIHDLRSETQKLSDDELFAIIANGAGHGRMPGFQNKLGTEMIKQLASYVRRLSVKPAVATTKTAGSEGAGPVPSPQPKPSATQAEVATSASAQQADQPKAQAQPQRPEQATVSETTAAAAQSKPQTNTPKKNDGSHRLEYVDLNSASKEVLMKLPGIAVADADRIIAGRPYRSTLQFKNRKIVSQEIYAQIAGRVMVRRSAHGKKSQTASEHPQ